MQPQLSDSQYFLQKNIIIHSYYNSSFGAKSANFTWKIMFIRLIKSHLLLLITIRSCKMYGIRSDEKSNIY